MSGAIDFANDNDVYAVSVNAGDTIVAILDADPERDAPEWNPHLGVGLFNTFIADVDGSGRATRIPRKRSPGR